MSGQRVILSYMREDENIVRDVLANLRANKLNAWMDKESNEGGADWRAAFDDNLRTASVCLSFFSSSFKEESTRVFNAELNSILARQQSDASFRWIPVRIEPCAIPKLPIGSQMVSALHWIDLFGEHADSAMRRIFRESV